MKTTICTTCSQSVAIIARVVKGRIEYFAEQHGSCPSRAIPKIPVREATRRRARWRGGRS